MLGVVRLTRFVNARAKRSRANNFLGKNSLKKKTRKPPKKQSKQAKNLRVAGRECARWNAQPHIGKRRVVALACSDGAAGSARWMREGVGRGVWEPVQFVQYIFGLELEKLNNPEKTLLISLNASTIPRGVSFFGCPRLGPHPSAHI